MKSKEKQEGFSALYRKYRPREWDEVVGQEHVVDALQGALALGRVSHAYLFAGARGTGKTSVARILARALKTAEIDLYEIDAASSRKIDDARELRDTVLSLPFESPYKVYILDEVHMLTKEAFNALLKTLEEPPPHIVFILATTEIDKLPETIVSRCELHSFRKPNQKMLAEIVSRAAKKEGYDISRASAELIALLGDGSFRDAYGILQKTITISADKKISEEEVLRVTGAPKGDIANRIIQSLAERNTEKGLSAIAEAVAAHGDMKIFAKLILQKMRFALLLRIAPEMEKEIARELSESDFAFLKKIPANGLTSQTLLTFLEYYDLIGRSHISHLPLELAVIKVCETAKK
ncbi:MAG: DNA polymerase III, subunit gamma and tau [Candidatus Taylorbacteria bacterium RIFCSPHIGHO2_02_FULL_47_18]|uniref:DNA polymerase III subunit gamma/tau n=1 Tax=Candidatus Taylorbacteria bacterium RIFCSPLOWO2_01_FULL_48_100 TaxID=1802322 RepID=A0A1G2NEC2_9BACT|nr:MAG: DNA polymerase III, subunit gamma and tau [Candidatus Taylorbacteria bacterium RIFCSPHIGHO2_01_FULL_48_38]OHA28404.1 MAG: DNA polymerase III, subunit gamma and tau [Candidatus Taylorbacteria bacterium RIFCSPHIGHO2_02_FULL_47_18]OHA34413.1 MAG: DNA polymerase III, subunit gamma and tau [Candidatus Taylorbacteria bacterium RIFCSPLOWO2_01_FULL_48_100]OHA40159.1 MAG: DNA polymerase III, subunit gamma and tau [Candidatus Taylorbacteria bacterium RIFCSPLOWO2_02_FULL_48_16]OHA45506.1 MAG: DNA 